MNFICQLFLFFDIIPIASNQLDEFFYRLLFGNILFNAFFFLVEAHFTTTGTYISIISIRHFTRTVYDTAHDTNLQSFEVRSGCLDAGNG